MSNGKGAGIGIVVVLCLGLAIGFPIVFALLSWCGKTCHPF